MDVLSAGLAHRSSPCHLNGFAFKKLDAGEQAAINLALFLESRVLIIDEAIGRKEAQRVGLRVIGTLGILRDAHSAGLLDLRNSIKHLQATSFHIAPNTLSELSRQV